MGNAGLQELLLLLFVFIFIISAIFFLITLQNTLKAVESENRTMAPGNVWLLLIPVFGFVWAFIMVNGIAKSCRAQLEQYGVFNYENPAYSIGIAWAVCLLLSVIFDILSIPALILLIVYWIKVNEIKNELLQLKQAFMNKEEASIF